MQSLCLIHANKVFFQTLILCCLLCISCIGSANAGESDSHPTLLFNAQQVDQMREAINQPGRFRDAFVALRDSVDKRIQQPVEVPQPLDAGGGYSHEKHKKNYQLINDAGMLYQLSGKRKYADYVKQMLLQYAAMYPDLPLHPKRKEQSPGRLFWQSLNEAVWLVYSIQGYDAIIPALTKQEQDNIEQNLFRPVALFLSEQSPQTFNKIHNHGTWATAAVGMAGYVLGEHEWVEKALLGLDKSGKGGFLRQMDELFSPQGYYNEGPYYQRYALMPFVLFAKAIETNEPQRHIFAQRDGILLKAIHTTIELSYNNLFFPINDALKDKGLDTAELVYGVEIAYGLTGDRQLLSIAEKQDQIHLNADGLKVAQALDNNLQQPFQFKSLQLNDGAKGEQGALIIMRETRQNNDQALVFKATAQGLGHGHFDKLNYLFYDHQSEVVTDYGAARFLNVEAKYGGHYLPENDSYAKQTVAHNTLVVDQTSHFNGNTKLGNSLHPQVQFFAKNAQVQIASASMQGAYPDVTFERTQALIHHPDIPRPFVVDILTVESQKQHQYDLPVHYNGQFMDANFTLDANTDGWKPLGDKAGYQHLWQTAQASPQHKLAKVTWLNNGRFYTHSTMATKGIQVLFTQTGAQDPNFNLRTENAFILRLPSAGHARFVSVLEPHGDYNPGKEFTLQSHSRLKDLDFTQQQDLSALVMTFSHGVKLMLVYQQGHQQAEGHHRFDYQGKQYQFDGRMKLFELPEQVN
ncbi:heparinase II/III domain-containing protein [Neptunicella sp. SCSIO 80796]|uniref:heparinase II/III domain-containing protein n=1 Tax=Neptunicella plasticusilytica TaxID=3117012 RepID=UPI003A4E0BB0